MLILNPKPFGSASTQRLRHAPKLLNYSVLMVPQLEFSDSEMSTPLFLLHVEGTTFTPIIHSTSSHVVDSMIFNLMWFSAITKWKITWS